MSEATEIMLWIVGGLITVIGSLLLGIVSMYTKNKTETINDITDDLKEISDNSQSQSLLLKETAVRLEMVEKTVESNVKEINGVKKNVSQAFTEIAKKKDA